MIIAAFDPGLALTGYAIAQDNKAIAWGAISTPAHTPTGDRLIELHRDVTALLGEHKPDYVAFEKPFFLGKNTNAHMVLCAVGVLLMAIAECGYSNPIEYKPAEAKKAATGKGNADKKDIKPAILAYYGIEHRKGTPDDAYDALAGAIAAYALLQVAA